ncbi:MAG: efflux RND transporter periplasmic adaptor subunit [Rhodospirillales bacterium]|nr:efflux RND transporter periplasmic adaptor subunit [Rhodospirillales bacterium]
MQTIAIRGLVLIVLVAAVCACDQEPAPPAEQVRPIRAFTVSEIASGQLRRFSGVIEANDSSSLSFQVGGNVREVRVNQGERVRTGQLLAILDREPYQLNVQAAEARSDGEPAAGESAGGSGSRPEPPVAGCPRAVAKIRFESHPAQFRVGTNQLDIAVARLRPARRDLPNTTLVAARPGSIAARLVDPFVEVRAGQELFRIDAAGDLQAAIGVPETTIAQIAPGMPGTVTVPQIVQPVPARVTEIGTALCRRRTALSVKLTLIDPPPGLRPGMTAEVTAAVAPATRSR